MTYQQFLAYLFDRQPTRELAIELAAVVSRRAPLGQRVSGV